MNLNTGTLQDFIKRNSARKIACWGIGNYFSAFSDKVKEHTVLENIEYLIDAKLYGTEVTIGNKRVPVISPAQLRETWNGEVLVITTAQYAEIMEILSKEQLWDAMDCYISCLLVPSSNVGMIERRTDKPEIPAQIHYCWFGEKEMSAEDKSYIEGWKRICPEYEIICWNEQNYDVNKSEYTKRMYKEKKWAFLSDYVRMDILTSFGGFYFDTDVEMLKSIDELRYQKAFVGTEMTGNINSGVGTGCVKGNQLFLEVLESYHNPDSYEQYNTNSAREMAIFQKYGYVANNNYQIIRDVAVYPSVYFSPKIVGTSQTIKTDHTFSIHQYHYSWMKDSERKSLEDSQKILDRLLGLKEK
jgi:Mannosyltransferase OCH1 and related enzymes